MDYMEGRVEEKDLDNLRGLIRAFRVPGAGPQLPNKVKLHVALHQEIQQEFPGLRKSIRDAVEAMGAELKSGMARHSVAMTHVPSGVRGGK